jgi:hypothetical protein
MTMNRIRSFVSKFLRDTRGLTSAEWLIIGALVIGAAGFAFNAVQTAIRSKGTTVAGQIT